MKWATRMAFLAARYWTEDPMERPGIWRLEGGRKPVTMEAWFPGRSAGDRFPSFEGPDASAASTPGRRPTDRHWQGHDSRRTQGRMRHSPGSQERLEDALRDREDRRPALAPRSGQHQRHAREWPARAPGGA